VREVKKHLGDVVKKGDVLAILDSRELAEMQRR
jgi:cobalt-zinc-cadmium efflux system membrane fusion protein